MRWILCALLVLAACDGGSPDDTDVEQPAPLVGPYDGTYIVVFQRAGGQYALGRMVVEESELVGEARSEDGLEVDATGHFQADGTLVVESITNNQGADIVVEGVVGGGIFEGTYTFNGEEGVFAGSLNAELRNQEPTRAFDGTWEFSTESGGEETAAFTVDIKKGRFATTVVDHEAISYPIAGFITSDGTIVLRQGEGEVGLLMAEASVDQDTFEIAGIYRAGDDIGRVRGRKGD